MKLNSLIVTLAVGSVVTGLTIYYRDTGAVNSMVAPALANFSSSWLFGIPMTAIIAVGIMLVATVLLRKTVIGRRFELVGTNPIAAHIAGVRIQTYQIGAYVVAGLLYGIVSLLLSGFIRNPTIEVGTPYLLAPIAAAVLGGTAINGGIGSFVAVFAAALFLTQLDQSLKMLGLSTAWQMIVQGLAIAAGMYLSERYSKQN
ncbi:Ribose transport system permease protein RbsC [compost metagenome]